MKNEFLKNLKSYNLEGFGVLLAVSGGKDSMTMLDLFNYFKYELKLNLVVCHFNHSLRDDADRDEKFVKTQCEKYGLKFYSKKEDVLLYSNENKLSTEEGARFLRYKFFDEVKRIENLEYIATAHNKNDLAETVIMRILRGTGINGLIGIQSERGDLIRPILNFSRDEIEKYIEENNIPFVEDKTNFEELYLRNKIRLNLFPILKNEYNPRILDAISRLSNIAFDYSTISREYIASKEGLLWEFNKEKILVYIEKLKLQSRSFRNIMYREFFEFISKDPDGINYKIIEEIAKLFLNSDDIIEKDKFNVLVEDLLDRENLSSTGMQDGIAIPHTKSSAVKKMAMAVVISKDGKNFASMDEKLSKLFFMIVAPETIKREHLDILALIAKLSFEEELLNKLLNTSDKTEVIEILSKL